MDDRELAEVIPRGKGWKMGTTTGPYIRIVTEEEVDRLFVENRRLKQENEKLKKENEALKSTLGPAGPFGYRLS